MPDELCCDLRDPRTNRQSQRHERRSWLSRGHEFPVKERSKITITEWAKLEPYIAFRIKFSSDRLLCSRSSQANHPRVRCGGLTCEDRNDERWEFLYNLRENPHWQNDYPGEPRSRSYYCWTGKIFNSKCRGDTTRIVAFNLYRHATWGWVLPQWLQHLRREYASSRTSTKRWRRWLELPCSLCWRSAKDDWYWTPWSKRYRSSASNQEILLWWWHRARNRSVQDRDYLWPIRTRHEPRSAFVQHSSAIWPRRRTLHHHIHHQADVQRCSEMLPY